MNFFEFITFGVVQQHNNAVFIAELGQGRIQLLQLFEALLVLFGIFASRKTVQAVTREEALVDGVHAAPREAALLVDEQVIHNAGQPGSRLVDRDEVVELAKRLDQELLEQVLGLGLAPGQSKREPVQPVEMRPDKGVESLCTIVDRPNLR